MKSMTVRTAQISAAEPRSWETTRIATAPSAARQGTPIPCHEVRRRLWFFPSQKATNRITAHLTNSDGWMVNPPTAIQRHEPLIFLPRWGTKTSSSMKPKPRRIGTDRWVNQR